MHQNMYPVCIRHSHSYSRDLRQALLLPKGIDNGYIYNVNAARNLPYKTFMCTFMMICHITNILFVSEETSQTTISIKYTMKCINT